VILAPVLEPVQQPEPQVEAPRGPRGRADIRFLILIAAVLASSIVALSATQIALPSVDRIQQEQKACLDQAVAATTQLPLLDRIPVMQGLMADCMRPFFVEQARWVALVLALQIALAGLLYGLHPWWLARRRRLVPLEGPENADVLAELAELAREAGLSRPPVWLLAPYATTHGGQAFGLAGRRRVCLDVGLLVRYDTDRAGFRAVIRHELAHLHNRDIDRAYLTNALWWSFVVVALPPFVALAVHPDLLHDPRQWSWSAITEDPAELIYRLVVLTALTLVVYLTRNAILRAREVHADVTAARWDRPGGALPRMVTALPAPRRWGRFGTHPAPAYRVAMMAEPARLARAGGWDLAGLGLVTGLTLFNLSLFVGNLLQAYLMAGMALLAWPAGMLVVGAVVGTLRTSGAGEPPSWRRTLIAPLAATTGVVVSQPLTLLAADTGLNGLSAGPGDYAGNATLLLAGAVLVALWMRSTDTRAGRAAITVLGGAMFAWWFLNTFTSSAFLAWGGDDLPLLGWTTSWYRELTGFVMAAMTYGPLMQLRETPVPAIGMLLLWAVPLMFLRRRPGAGRALTIGAVAGLAAIAVGVALPFLARLALPPRVRATPEPIEPLNPVSFQLVYGLTYLTVAAVILALGAATVAATTDRLRPVLVPLAATATAVIATAGYYVTGGIGVCLDLFGPSNRPCGPARLLPDEYFGYHLQFILTWGAIVAIPAALLGAAAGHRWRRPPPATTPGVFARRLTGSALVVLGAVVVGLAVFEIPGNLRHWTPNPPPAFRPQPAAALSPVSTIDRCLLGTWQESRKIQTVTIGAETMTMTMTGAGTTQTFRRDGTVVIDDGAGTTSTATLDGHRVDLVSSGGITGRYRTADGVISYSDAEEAGKMVRLLKVDGRTIQRWEPDPGFSDDRYTCAGDELREYPADEKLSGPYAITLTRVRS
jgi:Zn-dependent protease with chaperone function